MTYDEFIASKRRVLNPLGFEVDSLPAFLFDWQETVVKWALHRGRAAIFADCGLGKTPMQLVWADEVVRRTNGNVLILAPLAVSKQTEREGSKFHVGVNVCRCQDDVRDGINIANYEMLHHFDPLSFSGLVLDESSILKGFNGHYRKAITVFGKHVPHLLACTATPAPNDLIEICNHAEFLNVASGKEIIALFFRQDGNTTHQWKLKGHARADFWRWMAQWSRAIRKPSDLGYDNGAFVLPELNVTQHVVDGKPLQDMLFPVEAQGISEIREARKLSLHDRVKLCADIVNASTDPFIVWCDLNAESDALKRAIPDAVEVKGSDSVEHKECALIGFSEGRHRVMVTKPSIAGFGLNWQHCRNMAFVGLSYSWEQYYQAVRRCWRFGQQHPVNVHIVVSENEGAVVSNIKRKERQAEMMMSELVEHMHEFYRAEQRDDSEYVGCQTVTIPNWMRCA